ncbi:hypothetical protein PQ610_06700 [Tardisphaera miroshnichenkoae]
MPWLSARSADKLIASQVEKLPEGKKVRVEDFKGDRWVEVLKVGVNSYRVNEHGFVTAAYDVDDGKLRATLRRLFEAEFPRSHQLRVSTSAGGQATGQGR